VTSTFDLNAASFERHRALPSGVPAAIRKAIWESTGARPSARVLDLGAGSGRIGRAFVEAGDAYIGVDFSLPMLREFHARNTGACLLQADGGRLPFPDGSFELVLLMQVLSGAHNRRSLLSETARVATRGGSVIVGQMVTPPEGVDARMKRQLAVILEEMGVGAHGSKEAREQSLEWLRTLSARRMRSTAASWTAQRTAREFLDRHSSGARFSALPAAAQTEALKRLSVWADKTCGSLDQVFSETHSFELHVFVLG
jgi:demethylmenaquinone methyltransferase/2-methoxy-6-polyprenyl-1,4-benzoquinol methylase